MKKHIVGMLLFFWGVTASVTGLALTLSNSLIKANIEKAVALIPRTAPRRYIIPGTDLHWRNTGAFSSTQRVKPELYGSYFNGKMYSWRHGKLGVLQAYINEVRTLTSDTMITWGRPVAGQLAFNAPGDVTVEAVTGCDYFKTHAEGWETGTIFDYQGKNTRRFAHVWSVSPHGRLFVWEATCPESMSTGQCQSDLERDIPGHAHSHAHLHIHFIVAEPLGQGVRRFVRVSNGSRQLG